MGFLTANPQANLLLDLSETSLGHSAFGTGLLVLGWATNAQLNEPFDWKHRREQNVISEIQNLEWEWRAARLEEMRREATQLLVEGRAGKLSKNTKPSCSMTGMIQTFGRIWGCCIT